MAEIPSKRFYKQSEVCQYTDTQPYVLRFWESEFPQLKRDAGGGRQRVYTRAELDLVQRIKELLYEEDYTLADARKQLAAERGGRKKRKTAAKPEAPPASSAAQALADVTVEPTDPAETMDDGMTVDHVSRQRYEDAVDEIEHLRRQLKESERAQRHAESSMAEAREDTERERARAEMAIQRLEQLLEILS